MCYNLPNNPQNNLKCGYKGKTMIYTYKEIKEKFGSKYNIKKALNQGIIFKQERGIYSDTKQVSELNIITQKYPDAIFSMQSAFYYHHLTDTIPDYYYLETDRDGSKIQDKRVKQLFDKKEFLQLGKVTIDYEGCQISIYSKERMFIELVRSKTKLPFDYYKEIIYSYRKIISSLDIQEIEELSLLLPKKEKVREVLEMEVL